MPSHSAFWAVAGLSAFLCLPFLRWRGTCSSQFLVSQPLTNDAVHYTHESAGIVSLTGIIPIGFLVQIPEQVERFDANIGALDCPFKQAPEVFDTVWCGLDPARILERGQ